MQSSTSTPSRSLTKATSWPHGLVMGGAHTVKGRGVAGAVHNGLGLVPSGGLADRTGTSSDARSGPLAGS